MDDLAAAVVKASFAGDHDLVKQILIANPGIDVNRKDHDGMTALFYASRQGFDNIVKVLIQNRGDIHQQTDHGWSPILIACQEGHLGLSKWLVQHGADVNQARPSGTTPLYMASQESRFEIVQWLVSNGAEVNHETYDGWTPLIIAADNGVLNIVKYLVEHNANVNHSNEDGSTPLAMACYEGHLAVVDYLLNKNADINKPIKTGNTALYLGALKGFVNVVEMLLTRKADPNQYEKQGWSPLIIAAKRGHLKICDILVRNGADLTHKRGGGNDAIEEARAGGQPHVHNFLRMRANQFQVIFSNEDFSNVTYLGETPVEDLFKAYISLPGVTIAVLLKVPKEIGPDEWNELSILKRLPYHQNLVNFLGISLEFRNPSKETTNPAVVVNYAGDSLREFVRQVDGQLDYNKVTKMSRGMAIALAELHKSGIVHSNISLDCFRASLTNDKVELMLTDFRYAGNIKREIQSHPHWQYCAPESLESSEFSFLSDVWMFGVAVWELLCPQENAEAMPFSDILDEYQRENKDDTQVVEFLCSQLKAGTKLQLSGKTPEFFCKLLKSCTQVAPNDRPKLQQIVEDIENLQDENKEDELNVEKTPDFTYEQGAQLVNAVGAGDLKTVNKFLDDGIPPDACTSLHWTPLLESIKEHNVEVFSLLLEKKANPNHVDVYQFCPIVLAAKEQQIDMIDLLVKFGANVHTTNFPSGYDLWAAARSTNDLPMVKLLVEAGIAPIYTRGGGTALETPAMPIYNYLSEVPKFGEFTSDCTMLIHAAWAGHENVVKKLLSYGVEISRRDALGHSALDYAETNDHHKIVTLLSSVKAAPLEVRFFSFLELSDVLILASGHFGATFRATLVVDNKELQVVAKVSKKGAGASEWRELEVLKNVPNHRGVLGLTGICMDFQYNESTAPALLVPFQSGGSLRIYIDLLKEPLSEKTIYKFARDMSICVSHLHAHGYIHCDIALRNFLISHRNVDDPEMHLVIADFGLAKSIEKGLIAGRNALIPWRWTAPETFRTGVTSKQSDVYMLGIALWELTVRGKPFAGSSPEKLYSLLKSAKDGPIALPFPGEYPKELRDLIQDCCSYYPNKRPAAIDVLQRLTRIMETLGPDKKIQILDLPPVPESDYDYMAKVVDDYIQQPDGDYDELPNFETSENKDSS